MVIWHMCTYFTPQQVWIFTLIITGPESYLLTKGRCRTYYIKRSELEYSTCRQYHIAKVNLIDVKADDAFRGHNSLAFEIHAAINSHESSSSVNSRGARQTPT
jgi:hypothetical protein